MWKHLSPEDKKKYDTLEKIEKQRYELQLNMMNGGKRKKGFVLQAKKETSNKKLSPFWMYMKVRRA